MASDRNENSNMLHSDMTRKKSNPPAEPLILNKNVVSDPQDMSTEFIQYASSVINSNVKVKSSEHYHCDAEITNLTFTSDILLVVLLKLKTSDSPGGDR